MDGKRLLHSLRLENFLSYGPEGVQLELEPLNILIGQNASGKSNLIQAVELLRAAPNGLSSFLRQGGGVAEWLYKGGTDLPAAEVAAAVDYPASQDQLRHFLSFTVNGQQLQIVDEAVNSATGSKRPEIPAIYYSYGHGEPAVAVRVNAVSGNEDTATPRWGKQPVTGIKPDASILSQRTDPDVYPQFNYLAEQYRAIKVYRNFNFDGPNSMRRPQQADLPADFLEEDGRNLSLVLSRLQHQGLMETISEKLRAVYEDVERISVNLDGGTVQTYIYERGLSSPIPAARLSDGTLRYLCLLTILYHPTPPRPAAADLPGRAGDRASPRPHFRPRRDAERGVAADADHRHDALRLVGLQVQRYAGGGRRLRTDADGNDAEAAGSGGSGDLA